MARATKIKQSESGLSTQVHTALREGALYVFSALSLILTFALFTYDSTDAGPFQAQSGDEIKNGVGAVGAWIADLLFTSFGRPAYLFSIMIFSVGWILSRERKKVVALTKIDFGLRFAGFIATLITSCALSALHFSPEGFSSSAGGFIGQAFGNWLEGLMKLLGASILLFCLWITS
ncbi:MAG: hypothetical protein CMO97_01755, partial [Woeseia sp.]|nr:hypothetical protein [Woeseia sp.]